MTTEPTHYGQCTRCSLGLFGVPADDTTTTRLLVEPSPDPWATAISPSLCAHAQPGTLPVEVTVAIVVPIPPPPALGRQRCPHGCGVVRVEEIDNRCSTYRGSHEYEWTATHLACGHTTEGPERIVGASPGGEAAAEAMAGARTQARLARSAAAQELPW